MPSTLDSATLSLNERLQTTNSFLVYKILQRTKMGETSFMKLETLMRRAICQVHKSPTTVLSQSFWAKIPGWGGGGLPGGQQRCAVLVRASNVGELTPAGQEAVRCAQATLLYPKCPQSIWYMRTGVPNTVHGKREHGTWYIAKM